MSGTCEQTISAWEEQPDTSWKHVGYKRCDKPATLGIDPFIAEIYEEIVERWLCSDCLQERKDDI